MPNMAAKKKTLILLVLSNEVWWPGLREKRLKMVMSNRVYIGSNRLMEMIRSLKIALSMMLCQHPVSPLALT